MRRVIHRRTLGRVGIALGLILVACTGWVSRQDVTAVQEAIGDGGTRESEHRAAITAFQQSRIVTEKSCLSCHTIGDRGGTVGPILDQLANRRSESWLRAWLKDPNDVKPGTQMPNFGFSDDEIDEIIGYATKLRKEIPVRKILSSNASLEEKGRALLEGYGCKACHRIGDEGRFIGVDLTWVGLRKSQEWEVMWLKNPQAWKPDTFMPNFHFSDAEAEALAAYLHMLQGEANERGRLWEARAQFFLGGSPAKAGEMAYNRFGCWGCHGKKGRKSDKNPNAAPDEHVPGLWGITDKLSDESIREIIARGSRPESLNPGGALPPFACPEWGEKISGQEITNLIAYLRTLAPEKKKWRFR